MLSTRRLLMKKTADLWGLWNKSQWMSIVKSSNNMLEYLRRLIKILKYSSQNETMRTAVNRYRSYYRLQKSMLRNVLICPCKRSKLCKMSIMKTMRDCWGDQSQYRWRSLMNSHLFNTKLTLFRLVLTKPTSIQIRMLLWRLQIVLGWIQMKS